MAFEENITLNKLSGVAASDLSAKQFYAVAVVNSSGVDKIDLATAAKNISGILQDNPKSGKTGCYAYDGITKAAISASTAITAGNLLEVDTGGTLKVLASGTAVAEAMVSLSSTGAVCIIAVRLLRSNAAFS